MRRIGFLAVSLSVSLGAMSFSLRATGAVPQEAKRFEPGTSRIELTRPAQPGMPFDVVGRRAAVLGQEGGAFEMWAYPLKILSDFQWTFQITTDDGTEEIPAAQTATTTTVRPECTIFTFTHAAFTVRQIMFVPVEKPAAVLLLDIDAQRPLRMIGSFRRELKLMWPAQTGASQMEFDPTTSAFLLTDREKKFAGLIGVPDAVEARLPSEGDQQSGRARFTLDVTSLAERDVWAPIIIVGAPQGGIEAARQLYTEILESIQKLYESTVTYYRQLSERTLQVITPNQQLNQAFEWAKARVDKGYATNLFLGSGLLAGFRASGDSLRPGFAWFFGRDALWTVLAINSYGDFERTRGALRLLRKHQRADGKIMHELSQAASFVNWADTPYYYASADATPLYLIALEDYYRVSGDLAFAREMWASAKNAYEFSLATDSDGNGLIENTNAGHGWVEGGKLLPVHEEIYLQGLWIEANHAMARLADALGEQAWRDRCRQRAARAQEAVERLFWNEERGMYAFARRQQGPNFGGSETVTLTNEAMVNEVTVMPAVPMWWGGLGEERGARLLEHLASAAIATDWGARLLSNQSNIYDPLSYHYGSVWPLFTGWVSMAAYRYWHPHLGYDMLMANAQLTFDEGLGAHTELLSGDRYRSFSFSSFDQVWSSAMVITPLVRGLLGLYWNAPDDGLRFQPQLPADWDRAELRNLRFRDAELDIRLVRNKGRLTLEVNRRGGTRGIDFYFLPPFPPDAQPLSAKVNGRPVFMEMEPAPGHQIGVLRVPVKDKSRVEVTYRPGTEVLVPFTPPRLGERTRALKLLRTHSTQTSLSIDLEGLSGATYDLIVMTPRVVRRMDGAEIVSRQGDRYRLAVRFPEGRPQQYVRKTVVLELANTLPPRRKK